MRGGDNKAVAMLRTARYLGRKASVADKYSKLGLVLVPDIAPYISRIWWLGGYYFDKTSFIVDRIECSFNEGKPFSQAAFQEIKEQALQVELVDLKTVLIDEPTEELKMEAARILRQERNKLPMMTVPQHINAENGNELPLSGNR